MNVKIHCTFLTTLLLVIVSTCGAQEMVVEKRDDFKIYFDEFKVDGSFVLFDQTRGVYTMYNQAQYKHPYSPASTFKICNTLIGLETAVIKDEHFVLPWDSVIRTNTDWNSSQDLATAFKNSTVWYYQELARRVGAVRMKYWLDKAQYGNRDTSGGIDKFWLSGALRISPEQQIDFLRRLHDNKLPFSRRSVDILKRIMLVKQNSSYAMYAKTGWAADGDLDVGWYVGYVEKKEKTYYFAVCIQSIDHDNSDFAFARKAIVQNILQSLKIID